MFRFTNELGFHCSRLAPALMNARSRILGVIVGDIADPYFAELTRGVEDEAGRSGYLTIVCNTDRATGREVEYLELLREYHAEGVIFAGGGSADEEQAAPLREAVDKLRADGIEVVSTAPRGLGGFIASADNRAASAELTEYLARLGHRQIVFVEGPPDVLTAIERLEGYRNAMESLGLEAPATCEGNFDYDSGYQAALRIIAGGALPDAIVTANDESGIGVLMALRQAGVRVPDFVSVAGIGGTRTARLVGLTTATIPLYEMGVVAARLILSPPDEAAVTILPHRVMPRSSTRQRAPRAER